MVCPISTLPKLSASSIIQLNIRGLYPKSNQSKTKYLSDLADSKNSFLIAVTETHLDKDIEDFEINIKGWNLFRSDRISRSHGGGLLLCERSIPSDT